MHDARTAPFESEPSVSRDGETLDAICGVRILQRKRGYRFNLDPILLAHFAADQGLRGPAIDLGTGSGVIPLILARKFGARSMMGLELQPQLYELAQRNVQLNHLERRVALVNGDLRETKKLFPAGAFSAVLCNPPYRPAANGNVSPDREKAIARCELFCSLDDVACAAAYLLGQRGAFHVVYPAARLTALLTTLSSHGLSPHVLRLVHPRGRSLAKLALVSAIKSARSDLHVLPPLILHLDDAKYTDEVQRILNS